jgi:hypothetical protein
MKLPRGGRVERKWIIENVAAKERTSIIQSPGSRIDGVHQRLAQVEGALLMSDDAELMRGGDTGSGSLLHTDPPQLGRDKKPRVRWARWDVKETLTCQTPMGRNLRIKNVALTIWADGRWAYIGDWANISRHAGWVVSSSMIFRYNTGEPYGKKGLRFKKDYYIVHGKVHKGVKASGSEVWIADRFRDLTRTKKDRKELMFYISGMDWPD